MVVARALGVVCWGAVVVTAFLTSPAPTRGGRGTKRALWFAPSSPSPQRASTFHKATTEREAQKETARVTYEGPAEISVEDTLSIIYRPDRSIMKPGEHGILYLGGFNGWDGEDQPMTLPMTPIDEDSYRVSLVVPNFARSIDFIFTDSVRYDTNNGQYYHLHVTNVQEAGPDGNVYTYKQAEDGSLMPTGMIAKSDPQELERMIDETLDEAKHNVNKDLDVMLTTEEQLQVQRLRAEASLVGERLGLGSMLVNEARDTFDLFDDDETMTMDAEALGRALGHMGFDLEDEEVQGLMDRHVRSKRPEANTVTLMEFMSVFAELDNADTGLDIC